MNYTEISIHIKTSLSDAFFDEDADNEKFDKWFDDKLKDAGLYDWTFEDFPTNVPGVSKITGRFIDFDDNHIVTIWLTIDDNTHSEDELAENDDLFNYIERKLAYSIIDELNGLCNDLSIPMYAGSFRELKFDGEEFYSLLYYSEKYGYFVSSELKNSQFQLYPDFEVLF